jgi:hypothetical protein
MNTINDSGTPRGRRQWWATPPRTGLRRLIFPWEYRHMEVRRPRLARNQYPFTRQEES